MSESGITNVLAIHSRISNSKPDEMLAAAEMFLRDAETLRGSASGGQYLLIVYSIELALKGFLHRRALPLDSFRGLGHDINKLLSEARKKGLTTSHALTDNVLFRLKKAFERAELRYEFSFDSLPPAVDAIPVAWSLLRDTAPDLQGMRDNPKPMTSDSPSMNAARPLL